jgi:hypothetical protein
MRERQANILVGAPGRGKSSELNQILKAIATPNIIIFKHPFNLDDKALSEYPVKQFDQYSGGKAKIPVLPEDYKDCLKKVFKYFRNGAFVLDDAQLYERDIVSKDLNDLVILRRHLGIDVFLIYHGCTTLPIQLFPFINNLFMWHTADNFDYKANKLPNYTELVSAKAEITRRAGNAQPQTPDYYFCKRVKLS